MHSTYTRMLRGSLAAAALCLAAVASAAAADATVAANETAAASATPAYQSDEGALQEVVVSAQKRVEDLKDVPISISAVSGAELQANRIENYEDVARDIPGVNFNSLAGTEGTTNIEIRGVSSTSGSATVGLYLDDISITTKNFFYDGAAQPKLFDLDRLEVLRGPQGTLYGDSSEGGTIRFITPTPDLNKWSGQLISDFSQTERGGNNYFEGAVFNAPIIDGVFAIHGSVGYTSDSGFIDHYSNPGESNPNTLTQVYPNEYTLLQSGVNWDDIFVTRLTGLINVADVVQIKPAVFYQRYRYGDSDAFYPPGELSSTYPVGPTIEGLWNQDKETPEPGLDTLLLPSLSVTAKLPFGIQLDSVTGLFERTFARQIDGTFYNSGAFAYLIGDADPPAGAFLPCPTPAQGPSLPYYNTHPINYNVNCDQPYYNQVNSIIANLPSAVHLENHYGQLSQEVRFSGSTGALKWVGGFYFENSWIHDHDFQQIPGISTAFTGIFGTPMENTYVNYYYGPPPVGTPLLFPDDIDEFDNRFYNERQYAVFGQLDYDLLSNLHASIGGRYGITNESYYSEEIGFYQIPNISPFYQSGQFDAFTPKATVTYDLSALSNIYASAAKGYRGGGPTGPIPYGGEGGGVCGPNLNEYGLYYGPNQFDPDSLWTYELGTKNRLDSNRLSIDAAVYMTRWTAIQQALYLPTCGYYFTANVGDARIYGGEVEINYRPVTALTLGLSGDAQHAYISDAYNPAEAAIGSWLIDVPEYTVDAKASYAFRLVDGSSLITRVDYAYQGDSYGSYQPIDFITGTPNPNYQNPGYGVLNASFGYTGSWLDLSVYAKNLANDRKIIQEPEVNTVFEAYTVHPRIVGLTLKLHLN
jgi:outer membrane receptor protein involved in Fe transport